MTDNEIKKINTNNWGNCIGSSTDDIITKIEKKDKLYHKALSDLVKSDKENIKKDKIIDLMTNYINELDTDEDICKNVDCDKHTDVNTGEINCKQCIKEYFINKVEKENK